MIVNFPAKLLPNAISREKCFGAILKYRPVLHIGSSLVATMRAEGKSVFMATEHRSGSGTQRDEHSRLATPTSSTLSSSLRALSSATSSAADGDHALVPSR